MFPKLEVPEHVYMSATDASITSIVRELTRLGMGEMPPFWICLDPFLVLKVYGGLLLDIDPPFVLCQLICC